VLNIMVFSKDRACQLDLFIRSFNKYYRGDIDDSLNVIYTYSNDKYCLGYEELKKRGYGISYHDEQGRNFKQLTESMIDSNNPYTVFFVDDDVFKNPFDIDCREMKIFETDPDILCLSLRLYSGVNYCYTIPCDSPAPELSPENTWEWEGLKGDWGYPMSLDGHVFRTNEIQELLKSFDYRSPNTLEGSLAARPLNKKKMICLDDSAIVNNPCNKVQTDNANHCGDISAEFLNRLYLANREISMSNIDGIKNNAPHQEIDVIIGEVK